MEYYHAPFVGDFAQTVPAKVVHYAPVSNRLNARVIKAQQIGSLTLMITYWIIIKAVSFQNNGGAQELHLRLMSLGPN